MIIKTAADLKHAVENTGSPFFEHSSMKFAGDTMSNYYVPVKNGVAAVYSVDTYTRTGVQCYELQRKRPVKHGLQDPAYFDTETFERVFSAG